MGKTATNISIILGLVTVTFAGYYLYVQKSATTLNGLSNDQVMESALLKTGLFIEHRQKLDQIKLDLSLFSDVRFTSLTGFSSAVPDSPIGRVDPFADVGSDSGSPGSADF